MNLGGLIERLELANPAAFVRIDFNQTPTELISYRGYYDQLAIDYAPTGSVEPMTVGRLLQLANAADQATFTGYKGGDYVMDRNTPVWVSRYGEAESRAIVALDVTHGLVKIISADIEDYA